MIRDRDAVRGLSGLDEDLDRLVRQANPYPGGIANGSNSYQGRFSPAAWERRRPSWHKRLVVLPLAGSLAIAAGGVTYASLNGHAATVGSVTCSANLAGDVLTGANANGSDPAQLCAGLWAKGEVDASSHVAPALQACVVNGAITVYPAADACARLGLAAAAPYTTDNRDEIAVSNSLLSLLEGCHTLQEARSLSNSVLAARQLAWSIVEDDGLTPQSCVAAQAGAGGVIRLSPLHGGGRPVPQSTAPTSKRQPSGQTGPQQSPPPNLQ